MNILLIGNEQTKDIAKQIVNEIRKQKEKEVKNTFFISEDFTPSWSFFSLLPVKRIETRGARNSLEEVKKIMNENEIDYFINFLDKDIEIKDINPKKHTFTFNFKLVKEMSEKQMLEFGFNDLQKTRSNLTALKNETNSKWMIVFPEKTFTSLSENDKIASIAVGNMFKRGETNHPRSIQQKMSTNVSDEIYRKFHRVGKKLFEKGLLPEIEGGTYGNFSLEEDNIMYITGRGVHKGNLKKEYIYKIRKVKYIESFEQIFANVFYEGNKKPSIDTAINFSLSGKATIHIHTDRIFANLLITKYNYPCGTKEELVGIQFILHDNPTLDVIQLHKHGLIVTVETLSEALQKINILTNEEISLRRRRISGERIPIMGGTLPKKCDK